MADDEQVIEPEEGEALELSSGQGLTLKIKRNRVLILQLIEMEDTVFHHDSAVLMPAGPLDEDPDPAQELITGLSVARTALRFAELYPAKQLLVAGHTDTSGRASYNLELSLLRARNVLGYLRGQRAEWAQICQERHQVEDYQQILAWLAATRGWNCHPGDIDDKDGPKTRGALKNFRAAYSEEHAPLEGGNKPSAGDWEAFYDCYDHHLAELLEVEPGELGAARARLQVADPGAVGCGESWPVEEVGVDGHECAANRRVELLFFDEGEAPELACHAGEACQPEACPLYVPGRYRAERLPVDVDHYVPADGNVLLLDLDDELSEELPAGLSIRLQAGATQPQELAWSAGKVEEGRRVFEFSGLPRGVPCDLHALASGSEWLLWSRQVIDDPQGAVNWTQVLADLIDHQGEDLGAIADEGEMPADLGREQEPGDGVLS